MKEGKKAGRKHKNDQIIFFVGEFRQSPRVKYSLIIVYKGVCLKNYYDICSHVLFGTWRNNGFCKNMGVSFSCEKKKLYICKPKNYKQRII